MKLSFRRLFGGSRLDAAEAARTGMLAPDAGDAVARAFLRAARDGRRVVDVRDVLAGLVESGALAGLFPAWRVEPLIPRVPKGDPLSADDVRTSRIVTRLLRNGALRMQAANRSQVRAADVFAFLFLVDPRLGRELDAAGADAAAAVCFAAHGVVRHPPIDEASAPAGDELALVVHNDDFTPQDFVATALSRALGVDAKKAMELMLRIHDSEDAEVAVMERADAIRLANEMLAAASAAGVPLKVSVRVP